MKKSIFVLFILALTLAACQAGTPQVAVTPEVTVTTTLEPTPTPQPTATPILSAEMEELHKSLEGTPYGLGWDEDQSALVLTYTDPITSEKTNVPEIKFDRDGSGKWTRKYSFTSPSGNLITNEIVGSVLDIAVVSSQIDNNITLEMDGWKIVDGKMLREHLVSYGRETTIEKYTTKEAVLMLLKDSETSRVNSVTGQIDSTQSDAKARKLLALNNKNLHFSVDGFITEAIQYFYDSGIYVTENGIKVDKLDTLFYAWAVMYGLSDATAVKWEIIEPSGSNRKIEIVVDAALGINWNDFYKTGLTKFQIDIKNLR